MNDPTTKERLKNLIAKSKEDKLIKELLLLAKHQPSDVADQIFSLSAAYNKYTEEISFGILRGENERVASNDLSRRMLMVINQLEEESEDDHPEPQTPPSTLTDLTDTSPVLTSSKGVRMLKTLALFIFASGLVFWFTQSSFGGKHPPNSKVWLGTWAQEIEASGDLTNSGTITFETVDGSLKGKSEMKHSNGSFTEMELFNITFDENQNSIQGLWRSEELETDGSFKFSLQNQSSFNGFYTIRPELEKKFFWNGKR